MKTTINRLAAILLAIITVLGVVPMSAMAAAPTFTDVPSNAWFYEPVMYMAGNNPTGTAYMSGTGNNKFSPKQTTTRAMFVTVLGRIAGINTSDYTTSSFRDVSTDAWYAPYVEWAAQNDIVSGIGDNKFGPNNYVTREQSAVILYNYLLNNNYTLTVNDSFLNNSPDKNNVSSWAVPAMKWATSAALMRGDNNGALRPRYSATRAEIATIFRRFIEIKADLDNDEPDTCDHEWVASKTEQVEVRREKVREWIHADRLNLLWRCSDCSINVEQWIEDYIAQYPEATRNDALNAWDRWYYDEKPYYSCGPYQVVNSGIFDVTFKDTSEKVYCADLPTEYTCSKCHRIKKAATTEITAYINDTNVWTPHMKDVEVYPAWDENLVIIRDAVNIFTDIRYPRGTKVATIHHDAYVNQEIDYFENNETGEKIYVEMTGCRHPEWRRADTDEFAPSGERIRRLQCTSCKMFHVGPTGGISHYDYDTVPKPDINVEESQYEIIMSCCDNPDWRYISLGNDVEHYGEFQCKNCGKYLPYP